MGIFDFLRSTSDGSQDHGLSPDYLFAHAALRSQALSQPLQVLSTLSGPNAEAMFEDLIQEVKKEAGKSPSFTADQLKVHVQRVSKFPCIVVEFPEPTEMAEVHMVAVIVEINLDLQSVPADPAQVGGRFFTLEKSITLSNEPRTVLGEWTRTEHANYGEGPKPRVDEFVATISKYF